jgi:hypothetical protein
LYGKYELTSSAILAYVPHPKIMIPTLKTTALNIAGFRFFFSYHAPSLKSKYHMTGGR